MHKGKAIRIRSLLLNANALYKITQKLCTQCCKLHVYFTNNDYFAWSFDQSKEINSIQIDAMKKNAHAYAREVETED